MNPPRPRPSSKDFAKPRRLRQQRWQSSATLFLTMALLVFAVNRGHSQIDTVGLMLNTPDAYEGFTLLAPLASQNAYLIDNQGRLINRWTSGYPPGNSAYLLTNGNLLRCGQDTNNTAFIAGGRGGKVQEFDWDGNLLWEFTYSNGQVRQHHDALKLPNGNVLILAWEMKTEAEAIAAGRNPSLVSEELWPEHLVEVEPTGPDSGNIVWRWHAWDHLIQDFDATKANHGVVADFPGRIDLNYPDSNSADWIHCNGIDYNPELDQILISAFSFGEIWIVDHSTTTGEAAGSTGGNSGKGGDLLYRWGNPAAYRAGATTDRRLFFQHNPNWIDPGLPGEGNILIFNNGRTRPGGNYSSIDEIAPPVDSMGNYSKAVGAPYGPTELTWTYEASPPSSFYAALVSGTQRLPNGNTLICNGPSGVIFEVTTESSTVWEYQNPVTQSGPLVQGMFPANQTAVFRATRHALDYPGLEGRDLTHHGTVELYPELPFAIIDVNRGDQDAFLRWSGSPDQRYQIDHRPNLGASEWSEIAAVDSIGSEATFTDSDPERIAAPEGYYRVTQLPEEVD